MIPCQQCGHVNPLATKYCRKCGAKITVTYSEVAQSVAETTKTNADQRWFEHGRSYIGIGAFVLICAILGRCALAPDLPAPDLLPAPAEELLSERMPNTRAAAAVAEAAPPRLLRRRAQAARTLRDLGIDAKAIAALQKPIIAAQQPDGLWLGPDPLAASGLALLALQALPLGDAETAATRGRSALRAIELKDKPALGRAIAAAALADAGQLPAPLVPALCLAPPDAALASVQALGWLALPAPRPSAKGLAAALPGAGWAWLMDPSAPPPAAVDLRTVAAEERLGWALAAWHTGLDPDAQAQAYAAWTRLTLGAEPALPWAPQAQQVLLLTAPLREVVAP